MCSTIFNFVINKIFNLDNNYLLLSDIPNINNLLTQNYLSKTLHFVLSRKNKLYKTIDFINNSIHCDIYKSFINLIYNDFINQTSNNIFSLNHINQNINIKYYHFWFKILEKNLLPKHNSFFIKHNNNNVFFNIEWNIKLYNNHYFIIINIFNSDTFIVLNKFQNIDSFNIFSLDHHTFFNIYNDLYPLLIPHS